MSQGGALMTGAGVQGQINNRSTNILIKKVLTVINMKVVKKLWQLIKEMLMKLLRNFARQRRKSRNNLQSKRLEQPTNILLGTYGRPVTVFNKWVCESENMATVLRSYLV